MLLIIILLSFAIIGIGYAMINKDIVSGYGEIRYIELEGGFWAIISDDGEGYDVFNLPEDFKVEGLKVRFKVKKDDNLGGIHMWGTIVEILDIEKLS